MAGEVIQFGDSVKDIVSKMSNGNPGAINVMMRILLEGETIDPQDFGKGLGAILGFDTLGIRGSRIWMLYKDVCDENVRVTIGMIRAWQLGFISGENLNTAIDNHGHGIDTLTLMKQVEDRLSQFAKG